jgi:hypothetical protein
MTSLRSQVFRKDGTSRPALLLVAGRSAGFAASFAIPIVLARTFDPGAFGTYKQLFLVYTTLYGLAQLGAAESLYYFVPRSSGKAGRCVGNALATLALMGALCFVVLYLTRNTIAAWLTNADIAGYLPFIGVFLAFTLVTAAFEIVMVSRNEHMNAARTYAGLGPDSNSAVHPSSAGHRHAAGRAGRRGRIRRAPTRCDAHIPLARIRRRVEARRRALAEPTRLRSAVRLAVAIDVIQANFHQWAVASNFDAATFAIYAVGCLQIPLVDVVCSSTANVMMVRMAEAGRRTSAFGAEIVARHDRQAGAADFSTGGVLSAERSRGDHLSFHDTLPGQRPDFQGLVSDDSAVGVCGRRRSCVCTARRASRRAECCSARL